MAPDCEVLIVGAGPVGLLLAAELTRHGADVRVLEQRPDATPGTRAIGVHPPVLAALEPSGATERILSHAARVSRGVARSRARPLGTVRFDRLSVRFPFVATLPQADTEAAVALGAPEPNRGYRVTAVSERHGVVQAAYASDSGSGIVTAQCAVIAAGVSGRELFRGGRWRARPYPDRYLMADVTGVSEEPEDTANVFLGPDGVLESFPLPECGRRLVASVGADRTRASNTATGPESASGRDGIEQLRRAVVERTGQRRLAERIETVSPFGIRRVLASRMRIGRTFVIGDAAHEVSPIGGQGMNLGLLDAVTLAPLLARQLSGAGAEEDLARWEQDRLRSARTAASLAALNTAVGRARSRGADRLLSALLPLALSGPSSRVAAHAYAMGFDRASATRQARR